MQKFRFDIDEKSFYVGLKNDMLKGHTATVATNLKQQNTIKPELEKFLKLSNTLDFQQDPDLIKLCLSRSKALVKLRKVLYFDNIYVNNNLIKTNFSFGMFIKEEVDPSAYQYGRIKLHYPLNFSYSDGLVNVDNKHVINKISEYLGDYAFLVNYFEIDGDNKAINFDITLIGERDIPYSKVFQDAKGNSNNFIKIFTEQADAYDYEIVSIKKALKKDITPEEYNTLLNKFEIKATKIVYDFLHSKGIISINDIMSKYPYSPVDMEFLDNGIKKFIILKTTCTGLNTFFLSKHEYSLLAHFKEKCEVYLVKRINSDKPEVKKFTFDEITNMGREIMSLRVFE